MENDHIQIPNSDTAKEERQESAHPFDSERKFIEREGDIVGELALLYFLTSNKDKDLINNINNKVSQCSTQELSVFRSASYHRIVEHEKENLEIEIEKIKIDTISGSFSDFIKEQYSQIQKAQEEETARLDRAIKAMGSPFRQVLTGVASAFIFAVIILGAQLVPSPFQSAESQNQERVQSNGE